jgi:hypothetical protein
MIIPSRPTAIPLHLGGRQLVCLSQVEAGDLFVWTEGIDRVARWAESPHFGQWTDVDGLWAGVAVYRVCPVAAEIPAPPAPDVAEPE